MVKRDKRKREEESKHENIWKNLSTDTTGTITLKAGMHSVIVKANWEPCLFYIFF